MGIGILNVENRPLDEKSTFGIDYGNVTQMICLVLRLSNEHTLLLKIAYWEGCSKIKSVSLEKCSVNVFVGLECKCVWMFMYTCLYRRIRCEFVWRCRLAMVFFVRLRECVFCGWKMEGCVRLQYDMMWIGYIYSCDDMRLYMNGCFHLRWDWQIRILKEELRCAAFAVCLNVSLVDSRRVLFVVNHII